MRTQSERSTRHGGSAGSRERLGTSGRRRSDDIDRAQVWSWSTLRGQIRARADWSGGTFGLARRLERSQRSSSPRRPVGEGRPGSAPRVVLLPRSSLTGGQSCSNGRCAAGAASRAPARTRRSCLLRAHRLKHKQSLDTGVPTEWRTGASSRGRRLDGPPQSCDDSSTGSGCRRGRSESAKASEGGWI